MPRATPAWLGPTLMLALGAVAASVIALVVALGGLGWMSDDADLPASIQRLWRDRAEPEAQRWLRIGAVAGGGSMIAAGVALASHLKRPLHGAARWAGELDIRRAGLRATRGIVLGR